MGTAVGGDAAGTDDEIVLLPTFENIGELPLPAPESWRYGRFDNFELLSNASDRATQRIVDDFQRRAFVLSVVWPVKVDNPVPIKLVLCGRGNKFDAFLPAGTNRGETAAVSVFLQESGQAFIAVDMEATELLLSVREPEALAGAGSASSDGESTDTTGSPNSSIVRVEPYKQLYREYIRYILSHSGTRPPAWLEEGLTQIIMGMKIDKTEIVFGEVEYETRRSAQVAEAGMTATATGARASEEESDLTPGSGLETPMADTDFRTALSRRALLPFDEFFAVRHDDPVARSPLGNNRWAKQAQAFVHYCLYGYGKKNQAAFVKFVERTAHEPPTEAIFQECFGFNYAQMKRKLRGYINAPDHQAERFRVTKGELPKPPVLDLREATEDEIGRIKGEGLRLAGHPEAARLALLAAYRRGDREPDLLGSLGIVEMALGRYENATKVLELAVRDRKANNPRVYLEMARLWLSDAFTNPAGADLRLSKAQAAGVLRMLFAARQHPPPMPEVYELIAATWDACEVVPSRANLEVLDEGVRAFPRNVKLVLAAARLNAKHGYADAAAALAGHGLRLQVDDPVRAELSAMVKAALPVSAPAP